MFLSRSVFHQSQFRYLGAFYLHSLIRLFCVAVFHLFNGIYIYQTLLNFGVSNNQSLGLTSIFFSVMFLLHAFTDTPALWIINRKGLRFSVFWGNLLLIVFYGLLFAAKLDPIFFVLAAIIGGIQLGLYWMAYHIYFVQLSDDKKQGEEISIGTTLTAVASIGAPAFGGLMISYGGYESLFLIVSVLLFLALIPLRYLPTRKDHAPIDIKETLTLLSPKKEFRSYVALASFGIIMITAEIFWPLYVLSLLNGVIGVGFMGSLVGLSAAVATIGIGLLIDKIGPKKITRFASSLDSIIWALRTLVTSTNQIFIISSLGALTNVAQVVGLETSIYSRARHTNVAAAILQREIGISLGIAIFSLTMGVLLWFGMPLKYIFLIVAVIALLTRIFPYNTESDKQKA